MFKNYFKIAFRNLIRSKVYSFINISGLAISIACSILMLLWIQDELSYDRYHKNADRIYRIASKALFHGQEANIASSSSAMGPTMLSDYPEIVNAVRFTSASTAPDRSILMRFKNIEFYEQHVFYADSTVFDVFSFPLDQGDYKTALNDPFSVVLTEEIAQKYFGGQEAIGKIIRMNNQYDLKVTGISKNIPHNSHFKFEFLISFATFETIQHQNQFEKWVDFRMYTYLLLRDNGDVAELQKKLPQFVEKHMSKLLGNIGMKIYPYLQPLTNIHLQSHLELEIEENGNIIYVYIYSMFAFFLIVIACINFINLTTASSLERGKEIGMRKVAGAGRFQLIEQFFGESIILILLSLLFAIVLLEIFMPLFNSISGKTLSGDLTNNSGLLWGVLGIVVFVGFAAGSYPALFLSSFQPINVLKQTTMSGVATQRVLVRKLLVLVQFSISIILIIGSFIVHRQLEYFNTKKLGFDKEQMVIIPFPSAFTNQTLPQKYEYIKSELLRHPNIVNVTASSSVPGCFCMPQVMYPEGINKDESMAFSMLTVDYNFLETFGMKMVQGRGFSKDFKSDGNEAFILNETAAKKLGWNSPIGKKMYWPVGNTKNGQVVGVVEDFHFKSFHNRIEPIVMQILPNWFSYITVKIRQDQMPETISFLEKKYKEFIPDQPFKYFFLDQHFDQMYKSEQRLSSLFDYFTLTAIFIACLGLFGISALMIEQRTKEIGIRKVLGASIASIVFTLTKEFIIWVVIANIIAWPIGWLAMNKWLQNFAYRINITMWPFLLAGLSGLMIVLLTVSWRAMKAALTNPTENLRYE